MSAHPAPRLRRVRHLAMRFFGALVPGEPSAADTAWVRRVLGPRLFEDWSAMPAHDRRHSIGVARRFQAGMAGSAAADDDRWLAAALVHDLGKQDSGLGVFGRVGATLTRAALGRARTDRWTGRLGRYFRHDVLGEARIRALDGPEAVARWAGAHHDAGRWATTGIPPEVMAALDAADDD